MTNNLVGSLFSFKDSNIFTSLIVDKIKSFMLSSPCLGENRTFTSSTALKLWKDIVDKPLCHVLISVLCQMNSIPADVLIRVRTNRNVRSSTHSPKAKIMMTTSPAASFLHRLRIKTCLEKEGDDAVSINFVLGPV